MIATHPVSSGAVSANRRVPFACGPFPGPSSSHYWAKRLLGAMMASGYLLVGRKVRARMSLQAYITLVYGVAAVLLTGCATKTTPVDPMTTTAAINLRMAMRNLWDAHVTWTRLYIISAVAKMPDAPAAAARLMQNQDDIGNAIKPYYGDDAGMKLLRSPGAQVEDSSQLS